MALPDCAEPSCKLILSAIRVLLGSTDFPQTMDEVDFTVLAATSVFTDLSEKCPPAEACRDAIDRTARATIRMANSTGGFGQVEPPRKHSAGSRSSVDPRDWTQQRSDVGGSAASKNHRQPHRQSQQYNLPGIDAAYENVSSGAQLPPIQSAGAPFRNNSHSSARPEQDGYGIRPEQPQQQASSPDSAIDPSLLPSPNNSHNPVVRTPPGGNNMTVSPAGCGSLGRATQLQAQSMMAAYLAQAPPPPQQGTFSPTTTMNANDLQLDFLQQANMAGGAMNGGGSGIGNGGIDETGNVDLGMGLGWEGLHHDFSDGQQYDLFDGFFFGGQQSGGGGMGGANGGL